MTEHLILGAAGHIDHGKTALVRSLSGVDTDRLPEEKRRGITIDLGFASVDLGPYRLGLVDVPGHERFIRNMLAGATGMDLVMLVVAADDSVKQQTREHLDILRLLDLRHGLIALTKCDLVDESWQELVEQEIREAVEGSFLADAPLLRTSVVTGEGLEFLRAALLDQAAQAAVDPRRRQRQASPFRMPADRAFVREGHGAVVTGSVASGSVKLGATLELLPQRTEVRVRGLQSHDVAVDHIQCGQRAAINLAGVRLEDVRRGHELAAPGHLLPARRFTVRLEILPSAPWPLKDRSLVRFHAGTDSMRAQVRLLDADDGRLQPGQADWAQVYLSRPAACIWGQPFVIRAESPVLKLGGGRVIDPQAERLRSLHARQLQELQAWSSDDPAARVAASLYFAGLRGWDLHDLPRLTGLAAKAEHLEQLRTTSALQEISLSPTRTLNVHRDVLQQLLQRVEAVMEKFHRAHPLATAMDPGGLEQKFDYLPPAVLTAVLALAQTQGRVQRTAAGWGLAGQGPQLSQNEQRLQDWLLKRLSEAGVSAPFAKELQQEAPHHRQAVPQLLELAAGQGQVVRIADGYYLAAAAERDARLSLQQAFAEHGDLTVSQIREILQTTRKFAVPFCEYLDASAYTIRAGDRRRWNSARP